MNFLIGILCKEHFFSCYCIVKNLKKIERYLINHHLGDSVMSGLSASDFAGACAFLARMLCVYTWKIAAGWRQLPPMQETVDACPMNEGELGVGRMCA